LGIGGLKESDEEPWYVVEKDLPNNILRVAQGHNHPAMFHDTLEAGQVNWIENTVPDTNQLTAKIRYRQADQTCVISKVSETSLKVDFDEAQRAITPGQSIVFYDNDICLGGGVIETMYNR
ncbi:MAG: tRNA 2-thiouridine(34) synthase MnmA, partial [Gammaproteobacteria bacterium]|nr:tRNA 2-thiouridine(34) synthase MnmA [Gammaproteobacteria bacterium]